jgi:hypothetical protein
MIPILYRVSSQPLSEMALTRDFALIYIFIIYLYYIERFDDVSKILGGYFSAPE